MLGITDITTYLIGTIIMVLLPAQLHVCAVGGGAVRHPRLCGCLQGIYR
jgi:hypothetical protein